MPTIDLVKARKKEFGEYVDAVKVVALDRLVALKELGRVSSRRLELTTHVISLRPERVTFALGELYGNDLAELLLNAHGNIRGGGFGNENITKYKIWVDARTVKDATEFPVNPKNLEGIEITESVKTFITSINDALELHGLPQITEKDLPKNPNETAISPQRTAGRSDGVLAAKGGR